MSDARANYKAEMKAMEQAVLDGELSIAEFACTKTD